MEKPPDRSLGAKWERFSSRWLAGGLDLEHVWLPRHLDQLDVNPEVPDRHVILLSFSRVLPVQFRLVENHVVQVRARILPSLATDR